MKKPAITSHRESEKVQMKQKKGMPSESTPKATQSAACAISCSWRAWPGRGTKRFPTPQLYRKTG